MVLGIIVSLECMCRPTAIETAITGLENRLLSNEDRLDGEISEIHAELWNLNHPQRIIAAYPSTHKRSWWKRVLHIK